jgi:bifunctional DNA-binding transcriptional regulator/antitoxin component of YhaV-PrlF toxin-antitoxin module
MRRILASVIERGRVTIPSEVQRLLGIHAPQKIAFEIEGDGVRLVAAVPSLDDVFGAVEPLERPEDFERLAAEAWAEKARRTEHELREG